MHSLAQVMSNATSSWQKAKVQSFLFYFLNRVHFSVFFAKHHEATDQYIMPTQNLILFWLAILPKARRWVLYMCWVLKDWVPFGSSSTHPSYIYLGTRVLQTDRWRVIFYAKKTWTAFAAANLNILNCIIWPQCLGLSFAKNKEQADMLNNLFLKWEVI